MVLKIKNLCRLFCNRYAEVQYDFFHCNIYEGEKKLVSYLYTVRRTCHLYRAKTAHPPRGGPGTHPEGALAPTPNGAPAKYFPPCNFRHAVGPSCQNGKCRQENGVFIPIRETMVRVAHGQRSYPHYSLVKINLQFWQTWSFGNLRFYCNVDTQVWGREKGRGGKEDRPYQLINISTVQYV